jgi:hypothetical protein
VREIDMELLNLMRAGKVVRILVSSNAKINKLREA